MNTNIVSGIGLLGKREFEAMAMGQLHMPAVNPEVVQNTIRYRNGMVATLVQNVIGTGALKAE